MKLNCRGDSRIARFKRKSQHNSTVCHSERSAKHVVELSPSEERGESARRSRSGIWLKISVTCRRNVTFSVESHPNSFRDPIVAFAPRFCSVIHSAKLRLQNRGAIFSLRMTYSGFVALKIIRGGATSSTPRKSEKFH